MSKTLIPIARFNVQHNEASRQYDCNYIKNLKIAHQTIILMLMHAIEHYLQYIPPTFNIGGWI